MSVIHHHDRQTRVGNESMQPKEKTDNLPYALFAKPKDNPRLGKCVCEAISPRTERIKTQNRADSVLYTNPRAILEGSGSGVE